MIKIKVFVSALLATPLKAVMCGNTFLRRRFQDVLDLVRGGDAISDGMRKMLVTVALDEPRMTRVLPRGNWLDESGEYFS